jgi:hypothetical protein
MGDDYLVSAKDALAAWDAGEIVSTIEMGGMGPGYEQAIHVCVFEIIRDVDPALATDDTKDAFRAQADATVHRISTTGHNLGFSGAQVGAAMQLAFRALRDGWRVTLEKAKEQDPDRITMVSRTWPHLDVPVLAEAK